MSGVVRPCSVCEIEYAAYTSRDLYCSHHCRIIARRDRQLKRYHQHQATRKTSSKKYYTKSEDTE